MTEHSESYEFYEKAYRLAVREYNARTARGENGRLAVLSDRMGQCDILAYVKQPVQEILLSKVVGTYTASRAQSFNYRFMPMQKPRTEFGNKWVNLCNWHLSEGITAPITVYEYMWRYYVIEGNKRVSVLKYFGAVTVRAEVTRLIPRLDPDNPDTLRYHAYLDYAKKGLFPDIELSKAERYERLYAMEQELLCAMDPETRDELNPLSMYAFFEQCYREVGCTLSLGDAFAEYLSIYGFPFHMSQDDLSERITQLQPQLAMLEMSPTPNLILDPEQEGAGLLQQFFSSRRRPDIVFAYAPGRKPGNWQDAHEQGRLAMQARMGDRINTSYIDDVTPENAYDLLSERAADADLVFVTTPAPISSVLRFALEHPDCLTLVYSPVRHDHRLHTYFGRYYESVFLCGVAAGLYTTSGVVAYLTPTISGKRYTSDVNAFYRGVRSVNRSARVLLMSRGVRPGNASSALQALGELAQMGADVVLSPVFPEFGLTDLPANVFSALTALNPDGSCGEFLAAPGWNWDTFYSAIVESYLSGGLEMLRNYKRADAPVTGFWWGLGSGAIDFHISDWAPDATGNLIRYLRGSIRRNLYNPLHGPIHDSEGQLRIPAHADPDPLDIITMDWIAEGIEVID